MSNPLDYIKNIRHEFSKARLDEAMVLPNAIEQFNTWFKQAVDAEVSEANAMVVSTVSKEGLPSSRVVFLRDFDENGFVFYTNYRSRKANEIQHNPHACANFFWPELERQIRIEGLLIKQAEQDSDTYFANRPRGSKIGAWVSEQSAVLANREELELKYAAYEKQFEDKVIPRPPFWGGYSLQATSIEFWQGRPSRLHDRLLYTKTAGSWKIVRLSP
jgi:pyridoxamine 5'-phosphate oxidase